MIQDTSTLTTGEVHELLLYLYNEPQLNTRHIIISRDQSRIVSLQKIGHTEPMLSVTFPPSVRIRPCVWHMPSVAVKAQMDEDAGKAFTSFLSDGALVVSGFSDKTLCLWDPESPVLQGKLLRDWVGQIRHIAFSLDESRIAGVTTESAIYVWDTESCEIVASSVPDFISQVTSIVFTSNSRRLVTMYSNGPSCMW